LQESSPVSWYQFRAVLLSSICNAGTLWSCGYYNLTAVNSEIPQKPFKHGTVIKVAIKLVKIINRTDNDIINDESHHIWFGETTDR